jgi:hypothetical protein
MRRGLALEKDADWYSTESEIRYSYGFLHLARRGINLPLVSFGV